MLRLVLGPVGYLGREEDMEPARNKQLQQQQQQHGACSTTARWGEWPIFTEERSGRSADLFWGAYAYSLTPPAAQGFLKAVRLHFRTMLFRQRRRGAMVLALVFVLGVTLARIHTF
jgi:hypothetical protein